MSELSIQFEDNISDIYKNNYATLAGYLPQDRDKLDNWLEELKQKVNSTNIDAVQFHESVLSFGKLLREDGIARMYVNQMINQVPEKYKTVEDVNELLISLNHIIDYAPKFTDDSYFPMSALFVYMMYTPAGLAGFRYEPINDAIRGVLKQWCDFLDSQASTYVINKEDGWLSPKAFVEFKLDDFIIPDIDAPHGGFKSYNDFFHRQIKPECRPIYGKDDVKVIVSPNDGTFYNLQRDVKLEDKFWIKSQPYSLSDMLNHSEYVKGFIGGDVYQTFLSGADYHRYRAPISGTVVESRVIDGLLFSELGVMGFDGDAGVKSQGYDAIVNNRGLVIIESDDKTIGKVAVMPIGITEISSVTLNVEVGQKLEKGDEIGWFSYGGSSLCLVFEPGAIKEFTIADENDTVRVNAQIAIAN